jgi:hypothetical protein
MFQKFQNLWLAVVGHLILHPMGQHLCPTAVVGVYRLAVGHPE